MNNYTLAPPLRTSSMARVVNGIHSEIDFTLKRTGNPNDFWRLQDAFIEELERTAVWEAIEEAAYFSSSVKELVENSYDACMDIMLASGREFRGHISIDMYHEGNKVVVEITDNGKTIDLRSNGIPSPRARGEWHFGKAHAAILDNEIKALEETAVMEWFPLEVGTRTRFTVTRDDIEKWNTMMDGSERIKKDDLIILEGGSTEVDKHWIFEEGAVIIGAALKLQISKHTLKLQLKDQLRCRGYSAPFYDLENIREVSLSGEIKAFVVPVKFKGIGYIDVEYSLYSSNENILKRSLEDGTEVFITVPAFFQEGEDSFDATGDVDKAQGPGGVIRKEIKREEDLSLLGGLDHSRYIDAIRSAAREGVSPEGILFIDGGPYNHGGVVALRLAAASEHDGSLKRLSTAALLYSAREERDLRTVMALRSFDHGYATDPAAGLTPLSIGLETVKFMLKKAGIDFEEHDAIRTDFSRLSDLGVMCRQAKEGSRKGTLTNEDILRFTKELQHMKALALDLKLGVVYIRDKYELRLQKAFSEMTDDVSDTFNSMIRGITKTIDILENRERFSKGNVLRERIDLVEMLSGIAKRHDSVFLKNETGGDIFIEGDRLSFSNAFANIIDNGVYGTGDKVTFVTVLLKMVENNIIVEISDEGPGIKPELLEMGKGRLKLFDVNNTTKGSQGTGLGTTEAWYVIVKDHGGTIEVESEEGKGTKFSIRLPLSQGVVDATGGADKDSGPGANNENLDYNEMLASFEYVRKIREAAREGASPEEILAIDGGPGRYSGVVSLTYASSGLSEEKAKVVQTAIEMYRSTSSRDLRPEDIEKIRQLRAELAELSDALDAGSPEAITSSGKRFLASLRSVPEEADLYQFLHQFMIKSMGEEIDLDFPNHIAGIAGLFDLGLEDTSSSEYAEMLEETKKDLRTAITEARKRFDAAIGEFPGENSPAENADPRIEYYEYLVDAVRVAIAGDLVGCYSFAVILKEVLNELGVDADVMRKSPEPSLEHFFVLTGDGYIIDGYDPGFLVGTSKRTGERVTVREMLEKEGDKLVAPITSRAAKEFYLTQDVGETELYDARLLEIAIDGLGRRMNLFHIVYIATKLMRHWSKAQEGENPEEVDVNLMRNCARETKDAMAGLGACREHSMELARRLILSGRDARVMKHDRHVHFWVEVDGYVVDAFPEGMPDAYTNAAIAFGDMWFTVAKKDEPIIVELYQGKEEEDLTEEARENAADEEGFYAKEQGHIAELLNATKSRLVYQGKTEHEIDQHESVRYFRAKIDELKDQIEEVQKRKGTFQEKGSGEWTKSRKMKVFSEVLRHDLSSSPIYNAANISFNAFEILLWSNLQRLDDVVRELGYEGIADLAEKGSFKNGEYDTYYIVAGAVRRTLLESPEAEVFKTGMRQSYFFRQHEQYAWFFDRVRRILRKRKEEGDTSPLVIDQVGLGLMQEPLTVLALLRGAYASEGLRLSDIPLEINCFDLDDSVYKMFRQGKLVFLKKTLDTYVESMEAALELSGTPSGQALRKGWGPIKKGFYEMFSLVTEKGMQNEVYELGLDNSELTDWFSALKFRGEYGSGGERNVSFAFMNNLFRYLDEDKTNATREALAERLSPGGFVFERDLKRKIKKVEELKFKTVRDLDGIYSLEEDVWNTVSPEKENAQAKIFDDMIKLVQAKQGEEKLIVALGTSWIKGYARGESLQYEAINPLITRLRAYCQARGIIFIDTSDESLALAVNALRQENEGANIIVMAGEEIVKSNEFRGLREDKKAFVAGVNNENLTANSYVRLVELLNISLKMAFGYPVDCSNPNVEIILDDGFVLFIPKAEPMDYDEFKAIYDVQIFA